MCVRVNDTPSHQPSGHSSHFPQQDETWPVEQKMQSLATVTGSVKTAQTHE